MPTPDIIRNLGMRFHDYRMRTNLTQKEVSEAATLNKTTLSKLESGNVFDISFNTLLRLLRAVGLSDNWDARSRRCPSRHISTTTI